MTEHSQHRFLSALPLLPALTWVIVCWDWPTRLGFFSDDWMILLHPSPGTAEAFRDILRTVATRPVSAPLIWVNQVLTDWSPFNMQILNCAMFAVSAHSVYFLTRTFSESIGQTPSHSRIGGCVAATAFLCLPSNVGIFTWGTGAVAAVPALPLFCYGTGLILHRTDARARAGGLILIALSHLSYEAFYFQEIAVFVSSSIIARRRLDRSVMTIILLLAAINFACITFNRINPYGIHKQFAENWLSIFMGGISHIYSTARHATREVFNIGFPALIIFLCFGLVLSGLDRGASFVLMGSIGILCSVLLYAMAGYGFSFEGANARVSIVFNVYASVMIGLLASSSAPNKSRFIAYIHLFSLAVLLLSLAIASRARVNEWADAWSKEMVRLSNFPDSPIELAVERTIAVSVQPTTHDIIQIATAPWEISGAAAWVQYIRHKAMGFRKMNTPWHGSVWFATPPGWFNTWDGTTFKQGPCGASMPTYQSTAQSLYVWDNATRDLIPAKAPWRIGCTD